MKRYYYYNVRTYLVMTCKLYTVIHFRISESHPGSINMFLSALHIKREARIFNKSRHTAAVSPITVC